MGKKKKVSMIIIRDSLLKVALLVSCCNPGLLLNKKQMDRYKLSYHFSLLGYRKV